MLVLAETSNTHTYWALPLEMSLYDIIIDMFYGKNIIKKISDLLSSNHVNSGKMTPDTTMSDRLTSSSLATPTEPRIMSAQLMSDSTQYDMRAALSQATVQHISIKSRV